MEYQPITYWPRIEDARPVSENVNAVETRAFLLSQDPDPLEIPDLVDTFRRLRMLKTITK